MSAWTSRKPMGPSRPRRHPQVLVAPVTAEVDTATSQAAALLGANREERGKCEKASGNGDVTTAADDTAEVTADDLAAAVDDVASEFYGVDISAASRMLYDQLEPEFASALDADPALIAFGLPQADVVPNEAITSADAAAVDTEMGAGAVEFEASDLLLLFLL